MKVLQRFAQIELMKGSEICDKQNRLGGIIRLLFGLHLISVLVHTRARAHTHTHTQRGIFRLMHIKKIPFFMTEIIAGLFLGIFPEN